MILSPLRRKDIYKLTFTTTSNYIMMMPYYLGQLWTHLIIKSVDKKRAQSDFPFRLHCDSMPRMPEGRVENVS